MLPKRSLWVLLLLWAVGAHGQVVIDVTVSFNMTNTTVLAVESLFGPSLGSRLIQGVLVVASPSNGCVAWPSSSLNLTDGFVALVERGNCTFETKVQLAAQAGAVYVIVYNNDTDDLIVMTSDDEVAIHISSSFVAMTDGEFLSNTAGSIVMIATDNGGGVSGFFDALAQWLLIVFLVPGVITCFVLVAGAARMARRAACRPKPVSNRVVLDLPTVKVTMERARDVDSHNTCAICLEDYKVGETLRQLPCKHDFHQACVDEWLLRHNRLCPTCKQNITIQHAQDATGERSDLETGLHTTTVGSVEVIQMQVQGAVPVDTTPSPSPSPSPSPTNHASVASAGPDPPSS